MSAIARYLLCAFCIFILADGSAAEDQQQRPAESAPAIRHVILVSIDGLMPATYTDPDAHGLKIPVLREMVAHGAWAAGAQSVFPTVTYPAHTSIATGTNPGTHGIVSNLAWDPLEKNPGGWRWFTEDIRVPTLWSAARFKGLRTALVYWPVTVGAQATAVVPEYWRSGDAEDVKLARALSTPGLLDEVAREHPDFWERFTPPRVTDSALTDIAVHLIENVRPHLLMLHIFDVDHFEHENGVWSAEHVSALEAADAQLARLIAAAKKAGIWEQSAMVVTSDHGFLPITRRVRPGVLFRENGLITLDKSNHVTAWKAIILATTGHAYVYVKDPQDQATRAELLVILQSLAGKPRSGIARVYSQQQIREFGGDPGAFLALEAADGFGMTSGYSGEYISESTVKATHGFDPGRPEMQAALLLYGPTIPPGRIADARLIDVAPTIAKWLGLRLGKTEGTSLHWSRIQTSR